MRFRNRTSDGAGFSLDIDSNEYQILQALPPAIAPEIPKDIACVDWSHTGSPQLCSTTPRSLMKNGRSEVDRRLHAPCFRHESGLHARGRRELS